MPSPSHTIKENNHESWLWLGNDLGRYLSFKDRIPFKILLIQSVGHIFSLNNRLPARLTTGTEMKCHYNSYAGPSPDGSFFGNRSSVPNSEETSSQMTIQRPVQIIDAHWRREMVSFSLSESTAAKVTGIDKIDLIQPPIGSPQKHFSSQIWDPIHASEGNLVFVSSSTLGSSDKK